MVSICGALWPACKKKEPYHPAEYEFAIEATTGVGERGDVYAGDRKVATFQAIEEPAFDATAADAKPRHVAASWSLPWGVPVVGGPPLTVRYATPCGARGPLPLPIADLTASQEKVQLETAAKSVTISRDVTVHAAVPGPAGTGNVLVDRGGRGAAVVNIGELELPEVRRARARRHDASRDCAMPYLPPRSARGVPSGGRLVPHTIEVDYVLKKDGDKLRAWDVKTDGLSLVDNYKEQFSKIIEKDGFDGLIAKMKKKQQAG